jgi:cold shock CspA family protein
MPIGKVKSWNDAKGFGFIAADGGSGMAVSD